jgi:hypothetical protein
LGSLAMYDFGARDILTSKEVLVHLTSMITPDVMLSDLPLLRKITWAMSIFCGRSHSRSHMPSPETVPVV